VVLGIDLDVAHALDQIGDLGQHPTRGPAGRAEGAGELQQRGTVPELLADGARLLSDVVEQASVEERTDHGLIKEKLRVELRRFFKKRSGRRPLVLPVLMEI